MNTNDDQGSIDRQAWAIMEPGLRRFCTLRVLSLLVLLLALPLAVEAQFNYTTNNGTITITWCSGLATSATIPSTINGLPVTSIGDGAFYASSITNVVFPDSITNIADSAFTMCRSLTSVTLPSNLISLGAGSFSDCESLTNVTMPNALKSIGSEAFYYCPGLTSVIIPFGVTNIGVAAFVACRSLTGITVDGLNPDYSSRDGVLFDKSQGTLLEYPGGKTEAYSIPSTVTNIGDYAFAACKSLTNLTMGNSIVTIGGSSFSDNGSLTSFTIPNGVTDIGPWAFYQCGNLTNISLPNTVTNIEQDAFSETILTSVSLPNGLIIIGAGAFSGTSLSTVNIPESVTNIEDNAFTPFSGCAELTAITVSPLNPAYSSVVGVLFNKSGTTLVAYPGGATGDYSVPSGVISIAAYAFIGSGLSSVAIPDGVTDIGLDAFQQCMNLTNATVGGGLTNIADSAFFDCNNLMSVYFKGGEPKAGVNAFFSDYYREHATVYYLPGTKGWTTNFAGLPTVVWNPQIEPASYCVRSNQFAFNITGSSNLVVVVEASTKLANPTWYPLQTNTLNGSSLYFADRQWTNYGSRFYRVTWP